MKNANKILKSIMVALGMEVKLEQMKLADGVTTIEADMFEAGAEIFVITDDEQRIALPVGDYEMEDGRILKVTQEGVIESIEEKQAEPEEAPEEVEADATAQPTAEPTSAQPKVVTESVIKEYKFGAEMPQEVIDAIEQVVTAKWEQLTATKLEATAEPTVELEDVKPIAFNPENETKTESIRIAPRRAMNTMDRVFEMINK